MKKETKESLAKKLNLLLNTVKKVESLNLENEALILESLEVLRKQTWHKYLEF